MTGRVLFIALALMVSPASSQTITCSTSFQGYRVCQGSNGWRSTEWEKHGMRFGADNRGAQWETSQWQGIETTTVKPGAGDKR